MDTKVTAEKVVDGNDAAIDWFLVINIEIGPMSTAITCHDPYLITSEEWQAIIDGKYLQNTRYYRCSVQLNVEDDTYTFVSETERECIETSMTMTFPRWLIAPALAEALDLRPPPECNTIKG